MKVISVCLLLASIWHVEGGSKLTFDWRNALPWQREMPKEDFMKNIGLRLVKRDWMPKGEGLPEGDEITRRYGGSPKNVYAMMVDEKNMYEFTEKPLETAVELLSQGSGYNPQQESIFVIHTISGDASNYFVKNMMIVFALRNFLKHYNAFAINMPSMQDSMERTIFKSIYGRKANYVDLGKAIGNFLTSMIDKGLIKANQIHFFGFCYSSQLSGYISRYIYKMTKGKVKSITALDPFSFGLSGLRNRVISKHDAELVYAYHSNSLFMGSFYRKATADFHFNSGIVQPGCWTTRHVGCSHRRAVTAFWYVILYPDLWLARKCQDWLTFKACLCNWNSLAALTFPPLPGAKGSYFLNTMPRKPYGYGPTGANCYTTSFSVKPQKSTSPEAQGPVIEKVIPIDFENSKKF